MKRKPAPTLFLKAVLLLIALVILVLYTYAFPELARRDAAAHPDDDFLRSVFLLSGYVFFIPILVALYQTFKLLILIDRNEAFSALSVKALRTIKYCAIAVIAFIVLGVLFMMVFVVDEDITPFITLGVIGSFGSSVIAVFAGLLQKLLTDAIALKSDNDWIV